MSERRGQRRREQKPVRGRRKPVPSTAEGAHSTDAPSPPLQPLAISILALVVCVLVLLASIIGVFTIHRVNVVGVDLPQTAIVQAADLDGKNIFRVRTDQVAVRLDQLLPNISVTDVEASFPNQITIHARLRVPVVAWQKGSVLWLLDSQGHMIGMVAKTTLPVISGSGAASSISPAVIQAVSYSAQVLPPGTISAFQVEPSTGLTVVGHDGWTADVGSGDAQTLSNRIAVLHDVLRTVRTQGKQLQFIDLRYRVPYLRYATP